MEKGFTIPANGPDFIPEEHVDPKLTEDRYVKWVQIIPDATRAVHHAHVYVDLPEGTDTDGLGAGMGSNVGNSLDLIEYGAGNDADIFPDGSAKVLKKGSMFRFEGHYHPYGEQAFDRIVEAMKVAGRGREYDCVVGISGGVDSTYVTYAVARKGLRVLAVHLDNGWNSELAMHNIERALKRLGVDLYTHVIDWEQFRDLQLSFLQASVPDAELPTDHAIFGLLMRVANQKRIRYIITGMNFATESINVPSWTYSPVDWRYISAIHSRYGSQRLTTYPHYTLPYLFYTMVIRRVRIVAPLNYLHYDRDQAIALLKDELGWREYGGKHHENVYTRWYQGWFLPTRFGYDKRKTHLSSLICSGQISRDNALEELLQPTYSIELQRSDTEYVIKKFGLDEEEFGSIMAAPRRTFHDYPSFAKLREGWPYRASRRVYRLARGLRS